MPTFLLTDVEGSTRLWDELADDMSRALERHDAIVLDAIAGTGGDHKRSRGEGDSHFAVFEDASAAVACALRIQLALAGEAWPGAVTIRVRIGVHSGPVEVRDEEYYGSTVNRAARLRAIAHGGQTVLSKVVADLATAPDGATFADRGSHRLQDLEEPERVFELLHPALAHEFPPLRSLDAVRHNLPVQVTSFVGRDDEVTAIGKAMEDARHVTLVGPGGMGKTRLSLQVAADVVDRFSDGVWFVELAPVTDPDLVASAVLGAMRLRSDSETLRDLTDALRDRSSLLVLDNCEQVIGGTARMTAAVMQTCPGVSVLATSREPLGTAGERVVRIPALSTPDVDDDPLASVYPAVRLFVERAMSARDEFVLDERTTAPVVRICRRLDGVPLAIELAAARVNVLTPQQIDDRLDDRFRVLAAGPRTADPRQRTLREAVDWSHDLLDERERILFRRLGVFTGGFGLEGAEQVCGSEPLDPGDVLDLLAALVDKSLVVADHSGESARYRMLETIAAYARERLGESGDLAQMRDAHLQYYAVQMRKLTGGYQPELSPPALRWARTELDNIRTALDHAVSHSPSTGLRLMWHSYDLWDLTHLAEGSERLGALLEKHRERDAERLYGLVGHAMLLTRTGDFDVALTDVAEAIEIARERSHDERLLVALTVRADALRHIGDLPAAHASLDEAEEIARRIGEHPSIAYVLTVRGGVLMDTDVPMAISLLEEALGLRRREGATGHIRNILGLLANINERAGRFAEARAAAYEAMEMARDAEDEEVVMYLSISLGRIALAEGDRESARTSLSEGLELAEARSLHHDAGFAHAMLGELARDEGDTDVARYHYGIALDRFDRSGSPISVAFVRSNIGRLALGLGRFDEARSIALESLRVAVDLGVDNGIVEFLELHAEADAAAGEASRALRTFGAAEALRELTGAERELVDQADYDRGVELARAAADADHWSAGREAGAALVAADLLAG